MIIGWSYWNELRYRPGVEFKEGVLPERACYLFPPGMWWNMLYAHRYPMRPPDRGSRWHSGPEYTSSMFMADMYNSFINREPEQRKVPTIYGSEQTLKEFGLFNKEQ